MRLEDDSMEPLPLPTIRRYPAYLREIRAMIQRGEQHVSSAVLAEKLGLDQVLTRKDLAMAGVPGKPRCGYPAKKLEAAVVHALGWDNATEAPLDKPSSATVASPSTIFRFQSPSMPIPRRFRKKSTASWSAQ